MRYAKHQNKRLVALARAESLADLLEKMLSEALLESDRDSFNIYGESWANIDRAVELLAGEQQCDRDIPLPKDSSETSTPRPSCRVA